MIGECSYHFTQVTTKVLTCQTKGSDKSVELNFIRNERSVRFNIRVTDGRKTQNESERGVVGCHSVVDGRCAVLSDLSPAVSGVREYS